MSFIVIEIDDLTTKKWGRTDKSVLNPNNLCGYVPPMEVKHNSLLFKCAVGIVASF